MTETLPYVWYTDGDVLARERERLFGRAWQYAGHTGQLAEPGSYFTVRAGDVPLIVLRDREGELRAHVNVCRHRGAEVVSGEGRCTTLQCHYHAWTYDLDGSLRAAPRSDGLELDGMGLRPAQVGTWGPFVFVNPDLGAPPLEDTLGDLPRLVREGGLDVEALTFHERVEYSLRANWKIAVENYLECYHCPVAHPSFSKVIDVSPSAYRLESRPTFASHFAPSREGEGEGQFHLIWPNVKVNVMPGRANLSIGPLMPVAADRTDGWLDYFFGADTDPGWIAAYLELDDQVGAEDRALVESVQRGMQARAFESGTLMLPSEELIAEFQRWVAAGLGQTPSRGNSSSHARE
jgi:phenylpropionate dioxygenase-like ring-hydroxylating dioxygenase large terminal subunit